METIKINIPKGYEVDTFDENTGEIKFREKPKDIKERIKSMDDVLAALGLDMEEIDDDFENVPDHLKAQHLVELAITVFNEGWEPDWSNSSESKYFPWFEMRGSSGFRYLGYDYWRTLSLVGSRLCLRSSDLATHVGKLFEEYYKKFMIK